MRCGGKMCLFDVDDVCGAVCVADFGGSGMLFNERGEGESGWWCLCSGCDREQYYRMQ